MMSDIPIVLFGAFDRHNLGDFLLGHAAAQRAAPRPVLFAGLRAADWRSCGGFAVEALAEVAAGWTRRYGAAPLELVHVGGETLDTDAWEAAVMLLEAAAAPGVIARLDADREGRSAWAAQFLASRRPAPYVLGAGDLPPAARVEFRAVGGVGLAGRDAGFAAAVAAALASAGRVSVRERRTRAALAALGIAAGLEPDPAAGLGAWLATELGGLRRDPRGYVALQLAASFADDASLDALAAGLDACGREVLLFRAGAAPWHDDREVCERLRRRLRVPARVLDSLHVLDICAAIAGASGCLASSLHALLVATLAGVPALGLERFPGEGAKLRAYAESWGGFEMTTPFTAKLIKDKIYKT